MTWLGRIGQLSRLQKVLSLVGLATLLASLLATYENALLFWLVISPHKNLMLKTKIYLWLLRYILLAFGVAMLLAGFGFERGKALLAHKLGKLQTRFWLPPVLLAGFLIRVAWVVWMPALPSRDSVWYDEGAWGITQGLGYTYQGQATAFWPPGYPVFLAGVYFVFGHNYLAAKLANIVLQLGIIVMSGSLARRMWGEEGAFLTALIMALLPGQIVYSSLLESMTLFTFLMLGILRLALDENRWLSSPLLTGLLTGILALTRPTGLLFPLALAFVYWLDGDQAREAIRKGFVAMAVMMLVILPWTVRNYRAFGKLVPISTNGGFNLMVGNSPQSTGGRNIAPPWKVDWIMSETNEAKRDQLARNAALEFIRRNPKKFLRLGLNKMFYMYRSDDFGIYWNMIETSAPVEKSVANALHTVCNAYYSVVVMLMILCGVLIFTRSFMLTFHRPALLGLLLFFYFSGLQFLFFGQNRFHFPVLPGFAMYAAAALASIVQDWRRTT